ncbi:MAG: aspartate--tRNA ligase [Rhodobacteraceae bacterium]|nr:aspartate--tRNA ligase [Paracoccaceae bacterium]
MHAFRSHTCAELTSAHVGNSVRLSGWVHRRRDHGGVIFVDLRDHYGITQVLCDPDSPVFAQVETLRSEWCIRIDGTVKARAPELVNPKLSTGKIEVFIRDIEVLGDVTGDLPLQVSGDQDYPEETRLTYRYLDLRREAMQANMVLRSDVVASMRKRMWKIGFREFQTPIITASSPEGARDFLVPSRLHPGRFYALPQAPQQFKQLLMVSGFDKYFQIAPCFRDEDPRADRAPTDFYQLDIEMSFVEQQDIFNTIGPVIKGVFEEFSNGARIDQDWPQISYRDAVLWYGTDKPDLRNPIRMQIVSEHFAGSGFGIFAKILEQDGTEVRAIPAPGGGSRKFCDRMNAWAQGEGLPGMGYIFWRRNSSGSGLAKEMDCWINEGKPNKEIIKEMLDGQHGEIFVKYSDQLKKIVQLLESGDPIDREEALKLQCAYFPRLGKPEAAGPLAKNIGPERTEALRRQLGLQAGDAAFFLAGKPAQFESIAGRARDVIGADLGLIEEGRFAFAWVVDFPLYEADTETGRVDFSHNPFSMPQGGLAALDGDPLEVLGYQYDLVCNGYEILSGAIRNHKPEIMFKSFELAGYSKEEVRKRFGGMVNAFQYGAPPHGGCAAGIDRIVMLLAHTANIREVVLFPMNQRAEDLMMNAPSEPASDQLMELGLRMMPQK